LKLPTPFPAAAFCDVVLHDLEAALGLRVLEGHPELVEVTVRQLKTLEIGAPNPAAAVVRLDELLFFWVSIQFLL